ncbi:hypothetical protein [Polynucleobacter sp.]|uniref:hypothetical protein n=1 Tax=Polynucleobacter sp. TaxID=2029855 RepID=UPI003F69A5A6
MAWFAPTEDISKGDIIIADDEYFRVRRITKARTIDNPTIQFIKTELEKWKQVVS